MSTGFISLFKNLLRAGARHALKLQCPSPALRKLAAELFATGSDPRLSSYRFFAEPEPTSLAEIAARTEARLVGPDGAGETAIRGVATLEDARPGDIVFYD